MAKKLRFDGPLVVAYGMGVDSTAVLVEFARQGIAPDLIQFADTGSEKPETYQYAHEVAKLCKRAGWKPPVRVSYAGPQKGPNAGLVHDLYEDCVVKGVLPSIAYPGGGGSGTLKKGCSLKWKKEPQDRWVKHNFRPALDAWSKGKKCIRVIGYDAGPADSRRSSIPDDEHYTYWYPLREWGWTRPRCKAEIKKAGLRVPLKSACYFCSSAQAHEITWLTRTHPDLADRIITLEACARERLETLMGLWRTPTACHPASMTEWIRRVREADAAGRSREYPAYSEESSEGGSRCAIDGTEEFGGCVAC